MPSRLLLRGGITLGVTAALVVALPLSASAHVRVYPKQAVAGADDTLLTFSVPTESASATTTRVVIDLPTATPFGDVSYQPVSGWSAKVVTGRLPKPAKIDGTTVTEAPTQVVWTAGASTRLRAGQFQDFVLTVGPMPDTGQVSFPTTQTYSDGTVVRWTEPTTASGDEPEHPAPVLYIDDAPPATDRVATTAVGLSAEAPALATSEVVSLVIAVAALLVALIAVIVAVLAVVAARRDRRA